MPSTQDYLDFVLDCLSGAQEISYRKMMGEYLIYYRGKVIGGIYDNRFLLKNVPSVIRCMPDAKPELPYENAKEMLAVDGEYSKEFFKDLLGAMYDELPQARKR